MGGISRSGTICPATVWRLGAHTARLTGGTCNPFRQMLYTFNDYLDSALVTGVLLSESLARHLFNVENETTLHCFVENPLMQAPTSQTHVCAEGSLVALQKTDSLLAVWKGSRRPSRQRNQALPQTLRGFCITEMVFHRSSLPLWAQGAIWLLRNRPGMQSPIMVVMEGLRL